MTICSMPEELKAFAIKHAPVLAEEMTRLCGSVIAKGMQGILQEVCRIQQERDQLLVVLKMVQEAALEKRGDDFNLSEKQWADFHAVMSKATSQQGDAP